MRVLLLSIALAGLFYGPAAAQPMTRAETYEEIARALQDIQTFAPAMHKSAGLDGILKAVEALRAKLANNPYIRVKGFSMGLPAGASVEFEFRD